MEGGDQSLPMPTYEEVLVCSKRTVDEEVVLLWKRALGDPGHLRVFCLMHAERLSYQVCDRALWSLSQLTQGQKGEQKTCNMKCAALHNNMQAFSFFSSSVTLPFLPDYRIVIICSNEEEGKSHIISKLQFYRRPYSTLPSDASFAEYLLGHFRRWPESTFKKGLSRAMAASVVDRDK